MTPDEIARQIVSEAVVDFGGWDGIGPQPCVKQDTIVPAIASAIRAEREKAEKAEAERDRLRAELDGRRMCVNCGTFAPVGHTRNHPLPECVGPDGLSACTFDLTPEEAWQHWSVEAHKLRAERDRLREALERIKGNQVRAHHDFRIDAFHIASEALGESAE